VHTHYNLRGIRARCYGEPAAAILHARFGPRICGPWSWELQLLRSVFVRVITCGYPGRAHTSRTYRLGRIVSYLSPSPSHALGRAASEAAKSTCKRSDTRGQSPTKYKPLIARCSCSSYLTRRPSVAPARWCRGLARAFTPTATWSPPARCRHELRWAMWAEWVRISGQPWSRAARSEQLKESGAQGPRMCAARRRCLATALPSDTPSRTSLLGSTAE
jgi:hypothetical protein